MKGVFVFNSFRYVQRFNYCRIQLGWEIWKCIVKSVTDGGHSAAAGIDYWEAWEYTYSPKLHITGLLAKLQLQEVLYEL